MNRRGVTLLELIFVMGISITVLAVGYRTYVSVMRMDERESRRESMMLNVQNLMSRIKGDIRTAGFARGGKGGIVILGNRPDIVYTNLQDNSGIERSTYHGKTIYKDITGEFSTSSSGIKVTLRGESTAYGRPIRVEISSFVRPRNRWAN